MRVETKKLKSNVGELNATYESVKSNFDLISESINKISGCYEGKRADTILEIGHKLTPKFKTITDDLKDSISYLSNAIATYETADNDSKHE